MWRICTIYTTYCTKLRFIREKNSITSVYNQILPSDMSNSTSCLPTNDSPGRWQPSINKEPVIDKIWTWPRFVSDVRGIPVTVSGCPFIIKRLPDSYTPPPPCLQTPTFTGPGLCGRSPCHCHQLDKVLCQGDTPQQGCPSCRGHMA